MAVHAILGIMTRASLVVALGLLLISPQGQAASPKTKRDERLVGSWGLQATTLYEFKSDGTGKAEGDEFRWHADGKVLFMMDEDGEQEAIPYSLEGKRLTVEVGGSPMTLDKKGLSGAKEKPAGKSPLPQGKGDELGQLLLSSPWCSFSYNKTSGSSNSKRVVFSRDGSWSSGGRSEGYSSGSGGTMASQHDGEDGGRWKSESGRLFMSSSDEPSLSPVDFSVTRNSNGFPIIKADGVEYSQCQ